MATFNDWVDENRQRAEQFAKIVPVGTPIKSVFRPNVHGRNGEGYVAFEGEFLDLDLDYPFPIHSVNPETGQQLYATGGDILVFWEGRWQTVDEIIGE
jgi:predicted heme/steroid binding protein